MKDYFYLDKKRTFWGAVLLLSLVLLVACEYPEHPENLKISYRFNVGDRFMESSKNDGSISNYLIIKLLNDTFTNDVFVSGHFTGTHFSMNLFSGRGYSHDFVGYNEMEGLTAVITKRSDTTATIELTGKALKHTNAPKILQKKVKIYGLAL